MRHLQPNAECFVLWLASLTALASPLAAHSETIENISIGPAGRAWIAKPSANSGLVFILPLDYAIKHCTVIVESGRTGSGDAATDFGTQWKTLVGPNAIVPTTRRRSPAAGWTSMIGNRTQRTLDGAFETLVLFTITSGSRTQSVAASANDDRCLEPIQALVRTVVVVNAGRADVGKGVDASTAAASAERPLGAEPLRQTDLLGEWYGLKSVVGVDGKTVLLRRSLVFLADGTYVSKEPDARGRYQIDGNVVTLSNLYVLTYHNGTLLDIKGALSRGHFKAQP